jgi:hypothetical protein
MNDTAVVDRPVEDKPKPKEPLADGGKRQPPKKPNDKTLLGYAKNPDDDSEIDGWSGLGVEDPFK